MDAALRLLERWNPPRTRKNYLDCVYLGDVPEQIDPEIELMMPEEFQLNPPQDFEEDE
jgi:hypothetical protein